ncbi:hypothetical protein N7539_004317 [Penicillium diatomitis]|uniref:GH84 domain-containing protein n=1 Tax=Penicillium diatomitis TaxID=2819901 RepID=A0A9W9XEU3_9EURO|nr:uncharacterized protein N7539_004317 [Penicillium diatomitis]KAJ5489427.1 hypothetical protein N7539_004317 [Penicillium diatomitis]
MVPFSLRSLVHWSALAQVLLVVVTAKETPANHVNKSFKITPTPQELSSHGQAISLSQEHVTLVVGNTTDSSTLDVIKTIVSLAGGKVGVSFPSTGKRTQIVAVTQSENQLAADLARSLTGKSADDLLPDGYILATGTHGGQATIVLNGVDKRVHIRLVSRPGSVLLVEADFEATIKKFDQARILGVRRFYIAFDDIPTVFHCDSDKAKRTDEGDWHWLADAQAYYLNPVQEEYIISNSLNDLETRTGEAVFSDRINKTSVQQADSTYVTDKLFLWDNFPVNDGKRDRLFLNPLTDPGAPDLYKYLLCFTSNSMEQAYATMPALAN